MRVISFVLLALGIAVVPSSALAATYYVNTAIGDDGNPAQDPAKPWKTIKKGLDNAFAGDTVMVAPGTYAESVESKRDGTPVAPIVVKSSPALGAIVQPPEGTNGFFVSHNYVTIDGFTITGANQGLKLGGHDGGGDVVGLLIQNNVVSDSSSNGIIVKNGLNVEIAFNTVFNNGFGNPANPGNGINHSGDGSLIHDNIVHHNAQFGIYVKDGNGHQVYDNTVFSNPTNLQILGGTIPSPAFTYYVNCLTGSDSRSATQARNPATPWQTIKFALSVVDGGDTVMVLGGTLQTPQVCGESTIESKKHGSAGAPIVIRAATPGAIVIKPPSGNGFFISHNYHTLVGLTVKGASKGIQVEAESGTITGIVLNGVRVNGNSQTGVQFKNVVGGVVKHSVIFNNGSHGILYESGSNANITNNLVYLNGGGEDYGITFAAGNGHKVTNNTLFGNFGGLRLGVAGTSVVSVTALNNIIVGSAVGIKEQGTGTSTLNFNNVVNNTANYQIVQSGQGANSFSLDPKFVNQGAFDFRLGRLATGQTANSPCIDAGSATSDAVGLAGRTAFTDKFPDTGLVDLGYHGTVIDPIEGAVTVNTASMTFNASPPAGNDTFTLSVKLTPGLGSDGVQVGSEYAEVSFGSFLYSMPVTGFQSQGGNVWSFTGGGGSGGTFTKNVDGSVDITLQVNGLNLAYSDSPISIGARIGDDFGFFQVGLRGTLVFP